jgi:hypothetical protein
MENKIPTAEQFFHYNASVFEIMIEFAKMHCEAQKKEILEKVTNSNGGDYFEESITNAYPLENIK